ncbi:hypothetical protein [Desulfobotulus sp.]|jgi:hypothetical protein|uniref:hypothetical protein n=1 Tax=Desulfobotulus sp. TaxID=1940337 RepID=UPI002A36C6C7|nr:hypothetical protein [Desulfobotulus sp.]MDY0164675.1 hypothetical protein [Desulfobotulus sp.]
MERIYPFPKTAGHFHCFTRDEDIKQHPGGTLAELANVILLNVMLLGVCYLSMQVVQKTSGHLLNLFAYWRNVTVTQSGNSSESIPQLSPPTKQVISSALERLTRSEIDALRQKKKQLSVYYQKIIKDRMMKRPSCLP